jgi:hypothetical protein
MGAQAAPSRPPPVIHAITLEAAKLDFDAIVGALHELTDDALVTVTFALDVAATRALGVAELCEAPAMRARFERLAQSDEWSIASLDALPVAARAAWYVATRAREAGAITSDARVPAELITEGTAVRARMFKVLDLLFEDDAELGPVVRHMHQGTGHRDLANDLLRGAEIYRVQSALVASVPKYYATTDEADAKRVGGEILRHLGTEKNAAEWSDLQARAATHLLAVYEEVAEGGRFLTRKSRAFSEQQFPSLVSAGRAAPVARKKKPEPPAGTPTPTPA